MNHFLEWLDDWYLGIREIDSQHLAMAEQINRLAETLQSATTTPARHDSLMPLIEHLLEDTRRHFKVEESIMREHDYPDLIQHHRDHVMLLAELQEFIREIEEGRRYFDIDSLTALKHWLINHVVEGDLAFARYLEQE